MFKKEKFMSLQVLSMLIALSALVASVVGLIHPAIYKPLVVDRKVPFIFSQDLITIMVVVVFLFIVIGKKMSVKADIARVGIIAYLFYAYGQYVIGTLYNHLYFLYLAIFSLSIFYLICAFISIDYEKLELSMPRPLRIVIATYCGAMPFIFAPQWISKILQSIQANSIPESDIMFSFNRAVYILDLCLILPVCVIASVLIYREKILGLVLGGVLQIKGFTLLLFVALGYIFQPLLFHQTMDLGNVVLYSAVSFLFLVLTVLYFIYTKVKKSVYN